MLCNLCGHEQRVIFTQTILQKYSVNYFYCDDCGLLQTEKPYWLEEAYSNAISALDTGILARNDELGKRLACLIRFCLDPRAAYLDVGGGYGLLTRRMRDYGFDFYWTDKYATNLFARGFEIKPGQKAAALVAFEVLEHLENPLENIRTWMEEYQSQTLIFSTCTYSGAPPSPEWWYYSFLTGQHIAFYQPKTLAFLAHKLNLRYYQVNNGFHFFTDRKVNPWEAKMTASRKFSELYFGFFQKQRLKPSRTLSDKEYLERQLKH